MKTMIKNFDTFGLILDAEENNAMIAKGYKFAVDGDEHIVGGTDPWSGMPNTACNLYLFDNREEAEKFAATQKNVFAPDLPVKVCELQIKETREERRIRKEKENEARKARKIARDLEKGITPEMRKVMDSIKRHENLKTKYENQIAELKKLIEEEEEIITKKKNELAKM